MNICRLICPSSSAPASAVFFRGELFCERRFPVHAGR
jgi:hypothetical protein